MALHAVIMLLSMMLRQTSTETDNHSLGVLWSLPSSHGILVHGLANPPARDRGHL